MSASGTWLSNAMVFQLSWQFRQVVTIVGVMKEFVFPSFPVLMVSSGFAGAPEWLSTVAFIVNDGDAGLCGFPQSRQSAAMVASVTGGA